LHVSEVQQVFPISLPRNGSSHLCARKDMAQGLSGAAAVQRMNEKDVWSPVESRYRISEQLMQKKGEGNY
jgi:hypothetical protein